MGGIDHQDQMIAYYPFERKTSHVTDLLFLYNKYSGRKMSFNDYRIAILEGLLNITKTKTTRVREVEHKISKIITKNMLGQTNRKRCRVCSQGNKRQSTLHHCTRCPGEPGLWVEFFRFFMPCEKYTNFMNIFS